MTQIALLPERGVVELTGADRLTFLQGLVSNDITLAAPGEAVWTALLTPQGRWLADFFVFSEGERLLLECERAVAPELAARLGRYKLRANVALRDASTEFFVHVAWDGPAPAEGISAPDPRLAAAGWRILAAAPLNSTATAAEWDSHRLALGLPEPADLEAETTLLLEAGFDELGAISWTKGCYMGQEITARTRFRGLVRRRLVPVEVAGPLPTPGTPVFDGTTEVGTMRSGRGPQGLAMLRTETLHGAALRCGEAEITPHCPAWMRLPGTVE